MWLSSLSSTVGHLFFPHCSSVRVAAQSALPKVGRLTGHCQGDWLNERKGSNARASCEVKKRGRASSNSLYKGPNRITRGTLRSGVDRCVSPTRVALAPHSQLLTSALLGLCFSCDGCGLLHLSIALLWQDNQVGHFLRLAFYFLDHSSEFYVLNQLASFVISS